MKKTLNHFFNKIFFYFFNFIFIFFYFFVYQTIAGLGISKQLEDIPKISKKINFPKYYSIHLMWINERLKEDQIYIYHTSDPNVLKEKLLLPVLRWALVNPSAKVVLWYDSKYIKRLVFENTYSFLEKLMSTLEVKNIVLKDIRMIDFVQMNDHVFSEEIPIYFRVDLLKVLILLHAIEKEQFDAAIFSDLEVGDLRINEDRMDYSELFSEEVMAQLEKYGLILNSSWIYHHAENQFLQMIHHPKMIQTIKDIIIKPNLARLQTAVEILSLLKKDRSSYLEDQCFLLWSSLDSVVYFSTVYDLFHYFSPQEPVQVRADIIHRGSDKDLYFEFNPSEDGYLPLGNLYFNGKFFVILSLDEDKITKILLELSKKSSNSNFNSLDFLIERSLVINFPNPYRPSRVSYAPTREVGVRQPRLHPNSDIDFLKIINIRNKFFTNNK